ncbi:hypothetical protein LTR02_017094 [Friedmanniomyces endolithicus]|nr:hypothetical protein LTR02_017094 [Friedmanniomyces endolithicus]
MSSQIFKTALHRLCEPDVPQKRPLRDYTHLYLTRFCPDRIRRRCYPLCRCIVPINTPTWTSAAAPTFLGTYSGDSKVATQPDYAGTYSHTSLRPVARYVVRRELQQQVEARLHEARSGGRIHSSIVVLVGLGGAGKSQLALNYIQAHRKEYNAVFWVDARLGESLERDYIQIDRLLSGHEQDASSLPLDINQVVTAVKAWLEGRGGRWLLVYDNADSPYCHVQSTARDRGVMIDVELKLFCHRCVSGGNACLKFVYSNTGWTTELPCLADPSL